jgi:hypothetical protein
MSILLDMIVGYSDSSESFQDARTRLIHGAKELGAIYIRFSSWHSSDILGKKSGFLFLKSRKATVGYRRAPFIAVIRSSVSRSYLQCSMHGYSGSQKECCHVHCSLLCAIKETEVVEYSVDVLTAKMALPDLS